MPAIKLYLFRHAESQANTRPHIISGRRNESLLTEHGIDQAQMLGRYFSAHKIIPTKVYSSPAVRTMRTATLTLEAMGLDDIRLVADDALQEMDQGDWVGRIRHEVYSDETLADVKRLAKDFKAPNGESMSEVGARMRTWANQFLHDNSSAKTENIFVFTHGVAIGCFASIVCDWSHDRTYRTIQMIDNCSISLFTHDEGEWRLEYLGVRPQ